MTVDILGTMLDNKMHNDIQANGIGSRISHGRDILSDHGLNGTIDSHNDLQFKTCQEPIAVCGIALRLPGGIRNSESFWDVLINGKDTRGPIPSTRYNAEGFRDKMSEKEAIKPQSGYFLEEDLSQLDTSFFSMTKRELEMMDPQQRQVLEVAKECFENAGEVDYRGRLVGCYVGTFGEDWLQMSAKDSQHSGGARMTGQADIMIANRVSYELGLLGPSMIIKTGCSASLVALHEACRALQIGDCTSAIVAGTSLIMGPTMSAVMSQEGIISPEGSCKTFDAAADGFARGEAINAIYVKPLNRALRDGNPIRAVIRGTNTNSDGRSASLMSPNVKAHELLMKKVYEDAKLEPCKTAFVECHGTGTPTGDPIETTAVGNIFGDRGIYIGAVKPNVGHSEGASGLTSLIKAVLTLEHKTIPPNIKFKTPNPKIPFLEKKLKVPIVPTSWPEGRDFRISINSFGIGGANAIILDSFDNYVNPMTATSGQKSNRALLGVLNEVPNGVSNGHKTYPCSSHLLLYSANTQKSLKILMEQYDEYKNKHADSLTDIAYTLALRREHLPYRTFGIANSEPSQVFSAIVKAPAAAANVIMAFSGQGAQWARMGAELILEDADFGADIEKMDNVLQGLSRPPDWKIKDELLKSTAESRLNIAELAQPACTAIQIALVNKLKRCNIKPDAVVGHSSGEMAAAYAVGALSMPAAMIVAFYRGYITRYQVRSGGMAALGLSLLTANTFLEDGVIVACENSPNSVTISGDREKIHRVVNTIKEERPDAMARILKVDMAYHSHHMKSLSGEYRNLVEEEFARQGFFAKDLNAPLYSSVTNDVITNAERLGPKYWETNLTSPVLFASAIGNIFNERSNSLFLEIGPHSTLAGPIRQIASEARRTCPYVPTMVRNKDCQQSLLSAFGELYQQGLQVDFTSFNPHGQVLHNLPTYPWDHGSSYWDESRLSRDYRFRKFSHHPLLGVKIPASSDLEPFWRNVFELENEPWLYDHKVQNDVVLPFAAYCAIAGEAVRQITDVQTGYRLRHVVAHTAMVLTNTMSTEILTTLRQHRLTDTALSDSWDFVISSYAGKGWVKHCEGQVRPLRQALSSQQSQENYVRHVEPSRWYEAMAAVGIVTGPRFQTLNDITTAVTEQRAAASISSEVGAAFICHPTAIDACLQLLIIAQAKGIARNLTNLKIPTKIEQLDVGQSTTHMDAQAQHLGKDQDVVECSVGGEIAIRLSGIELTPLSNQEEPDEAFDKYAAARLEWRPHFDFLDQSNCFHPPPISVEGRILLEEMTLLCIIDSAERLDGLEPCQPHFARYRAWLSYEIDRVKSGIYPLVKDPARFLHLNHALRSHSIEEKFLEAAQVIQNAAISVGILRVWKHIEAIFTGELEVLEILTDDSILTHLYNIASFGHSTFIQALSHTKPGLRILEVGAGTGGTTQTFLQDLVDAEGHPSFAEYAFTDISAGFFPQAKERFSYAPNMTYKAFDISQSPWDQGFEPQSFDLILAPNVIHATANLASSLKNLHDLLDPNGQIVLSEISTVMRHSNYVFGCFSGWWLGEEDKRVWEPYVSVERWDEELKIAEFTGVDTVVYDAELPYQGMAVIVSAPRQCRDQDTQKRRVTLICGDPNQDVVQRLLVALQVAGHPTTVGRLDGTAIADDEEIISTLDLESAFFEKITEPELSTFQRLIRQQRESRFLWLTLPSQVSCKDPSRALTLGMARTIRTELDVIFHTLEISPSEESFAELVVKVFQKVIAGDETQKLQPDREWVVDRGTISIGRYRPFSLSQELAATATHNEGHHSVKRLQISKPGLLDTLYWDTAPISDTIPEGNVEIEVQAVGLNFRDLLISMGLIPGDTANLGMDLSGIITRTYSRPSSKSDLKTGDRVLAITVHGALATKIVIPSNQVFRIPEELDFDGAATIPICFATALRSLVDVGQVRAGQSVLIHSAAGGLGTTAIQICKYLGAEVFATVGEHEKRQHLISTYGIPENRIFNSRDDSFASGIMAETNGRGVDIVLNSLSGNLLHASWRCVAKFGKLIELGQRDLIDHAKLDMRPFLANRSYCCVDIAQLVQERPQELNSIFERCLDLYKQGHILPISPVKAFDVSEIEGAFRTLQKGNLIGKAIIKIPSTFPRDLCKLSPRSLTLNPEAAYLIAGGVRGLGKPIALWLVERGARYLTFLSRSVGQSDQDQAFFEELKLCGCMTTTVQGRVENREDVEKAFRQTTKPIKGVIHLAMVTRDASLLEMTHTEWTDAVEPKMTGAWNLHNVLLHLHENLDFFLITSSFITIWNNPGQANYCAASTFLEAFCQYRRSLSLPCSVLNVCAIRGTGFVAENPQVRRNLKARGFYFLGEKELLDYLTICIFRDNAIFDNSQIHGDSDATEEARSEDLYSPSWQPWHSHGQLIMGLKSEVPLSDPINRVSWRRDRRMAIYHNNLQHSTTSGDSKSTGDSINRFVKEVTDDPSILDHESSKDYLVTEIGRKVHSFMLKSDMEEVNKSLTLQQLGLDSLMAIELRRWWKQVMGVEITVLEIMGSGTLDQLGAVATKKLAEKIKGSV